MTRRSSFASSLTLSFTLSLLGPAAPAAAQPSDWVGMRQVEPSDRERAYAATLDRALHEVPGSPHLEGVAFDWRSPKGPVPVRGVLVEVEGLALLRLRLPSPEAALAFVAEGATAYDPRGRARVTEVRGEQVVVLRGPLAEDRARVGRVLEAAWKGLPVQDLEALLIVSYGPAVVAATGDPQALEVLLKGRAASGREQPARTTWGVAEEPRFATSYASRPGHSFAGVATGADDREAQGRGAIAEEHLVTVLRSDLVTRLETELFSAPEIPLAVPADPFAASQANGAAGRLGAGLPR